MKFTSVSILLSLSSLQSANASSFRYGQQLNEYDILSKSKSRTTEEENPSSYSCTGQHDYSIYFKGKCDYDTLVNRMNLKVGENERCVNSGAKEVQLLVGVLAGPSDPEAIQQAKDKVEQLCHAAMDAVMENPDKVVQWDQITNKGINFDKEYFDGNTYWNEEYQTEYDTLIPGEPSNVLKRDAERVDDLYQTVAARVPFEWPSHIDNFDNCEMRTAMCCWVSDRQANDNNGNCAKPYDEQCIDADPADNTELCAVDMSRGSNSTGFNDGVSIYQGGYNSDDGNPRDSEGPTHCHGFAWGLDKYEVDSRYKANNLFYVSMYDHMYQRGYVRNVPGAPMCGCVEKMPIVTRSDCTEISAKEFWKFDWSAATQSFTAHLDRSEISFNACQGAGGNNDLDKFYKRLHNEGRTTTEDRWKFRRTIVGNDRCYEAVEALMFDKGFDPYFSPVPIVPNQLYSIRIYAGTDPGKDYLYTTHSGDTRLGNDFSNDAAKWRFEVLNGDDNSLFNLRPHGNVEDDETYLSCGVNGNVDMWREDDNSGRQKWHVKKVDPKYVNGNTNVYNIMMNSGVRNGEHYLSTSRGGNPDLYDFDDLSGRQRWVIEAI